MDKDTHLIIELVGAEGRPLEPKNNAFTFVHQAGVVVRDTVPISIQEWNKPAKDDGRSYVRDRLKDVCWDRLKAHFTFPELETEVLTEAMMKKVKHFALKKMAEAFNKYKNRIYREYVNSEKKKLPDFSGALQKQRKYWDAFLEYKKSDLAKERSRKNKINAEKKKYHHKLGAGGYITAAPKWDKQEAELVEKGVKPVLADAPRRVRNWTLGHGGKYDMVTGDIAFDENEKHPLPKKAILDAVQEAREGKFVPDRERDELSKALGNEEKTGRTRGYGADTPWCIGFPLDLESYRSRKRARYRKEKEDNDRLSNLEKIVAELQQRSQIQAGGTHELRQESTEGVQRRSSVASTKLVTDEETECTYPVDHITEKTSCELHVPVRNLTMKAAVGYALGNSESTTPGSDNEIPRGYARVGVDDVEPAFATLELDHPGADGEMKLLEDVGAGIILWRKEYIVFPGSASSALTRRLQAPSPHDDERDDQHDTTSPTRSPSPHQPSPEPTPPTPPPQQPTPEPTPPTPPPHQPTLPTPQPPQPTPPPPPTKAGGVPKRKYVSSSKAFYANRPRPEPEPLTKVPKVPPRRPYDMTDNETEKWVQADTEAQIAKWKQSRLPEPTVVYTEEAIQWAKEFLSHPSQFELNKPDDYTRYMRRNRHPAPTSTSASSGKRDVPQLGEQPKQSISPLKVAPRKIVSYEELFAQECGMTLSQLHSDDLPIDKLDVVWPWQHGKPLLPREKIDLLPTRMRMLHEWYLDVSKDPEFVTLGVQLQMNIS